MNKCWASCAAKRTRRRGVARPLPDSDHMTAALALARRNLGNTAENPSVGCVIVSAAGDVVGRGWTAPGGRPHAETEALARAGGAAKGATAYVTLEPCAHHGQTPPCVEALIKAGVKRVVIGTLDPDPRTCGKSVQRLEAAGVGVTMDICREAARDSVLGFASRIRRGRPAITLKLATSLDGRIATSSGASQWITGELARKSGHMLRAEHDAMLVGSGTAVADNPDLTCRIEGLEGRSPVRVIADGRLRLPLTSKLVLTAKDHPTWVVTAKGENQARQKALRETGVEVLEVGRTKAGELDLGAALHQLGARGLNTVLVEGGSRLAGALMRNSLVDRVVWYRAPLIIGGDGRAALEAMDVADLADAPRLKRRSIDPIGEDVAETYEIEGVTDALFEVN